MILSVKEAQSILWEPSDGVKIVNDEIVDHTRWSVIHEIVFLWTDGKHYITSYSTGATESQDESPFEHDDKVECQEVQQVKKTIFTWEPVNPSNFVARGEND